MGDYTEILRLCADQMVREGKILGAGMVNTTANTTDSQNLTIEKLEAVMRQFRDLPPRPAIDLFGHNLGDQCYTLKVPKETEFFRQHGESRQMVIVPETRIDEIYHVLRDAGIDVRLKPRLRDSQSDAATKPAA